MARVKEVCKPLKFKQKTKQMLQILNRIFPVQTCSKTQLKKKRNQESKKEMEKRHM